MSGARLVLLTAVAMTAFAANSILCRLALNGTTIDAATFTSVRLVSGALALLLIVRLRSGRVPEAPDWPSALALFVYAAAFSFAYVSLSAGTGALLLFGAVQTTMLLYGLRNGEQFSVLQSAGLFMAIAGLVGLVLPGLSAPPLAGATLMVSAGVAWGIYSLRGRGARDATLSTAGNFVGAAPIALIVSAALLPWPVFDPVGTALAIASGVLASGLGYVVWYAVLPQLSATRAAAVQLSVPPLAAFGGVLFLAETVSLRLVLASIAILTGIAVVIFTRVQRAPARAMARAPRTD
jgi:drug/metabolite transporter (DMT)-like permease